MGSRGAADISPAWITAACAVAAIVAGLVVWAVRWVWKILVRTLQFLHDWEGEPEREGVPARPGVMLRLQKVEGIVTDIHGQVYPNGSASLRDVVDRSAAALADIKAEQASVRAELLKVQRTGRED
jgi:hypothetical protein